MIQEGQLSVTGGSMYKKYRSTKPVQDQSDVQLTGDQGLQVLSLPGPSKFFHGD